MNVDLPVELWLKILSYLPRGFVRKMLGINRICFELAMYDIYQELEVINGNERTLEHVRLARQPAIARHLRALYIRPSFLPTQLARDRSSWHPIKKLLIFPHSGVPDSPTLVDGPSNSEERFAKKTLKALISALPHFDNLEQVTIFLHNFSMTTYFLRFLQQLWLVKGSSIRTLKVDATLDKIPSFLDVLQKRRLLQNLEFFYLSLAFSHYSPSQPNTENICNAIVSFIRCHRNTLHTLIIHEPSLLDLSSLFRGLGRLPALRRFELPITMDKYSLSQISALTSFLSDNSDNLERLLLWRKPMGLFGPVDDDTYRNFFEEELPTLSFPVLSELNIDWCARNYPYRRAPSVTSILPPFRHFAPELKKLTLHNPDLFLSFYELKELLKNCSSSGVDLESLHLHLHILSPAHLTEISSHLPRLKALEIIYEVISTEPLRAVDILDGADAFRRALRACKYDKRRLRYLRVSRKSHAMKGIRMLY